MTIPQKEKQGVQLKNATWNPDSIPAAALIQPTFTAEERSVFDISLFASLQSEKCDAIITLNAANFAYITGIVLPFSEEQPHKPFAALKTLDPANQVIIVPPDWALAVYQQGWLGQLLTYDAHQGGSRTSFLNILVKAVNTQNLGNKIIAFDNHNQPQAVVSALTSALPQVKWFAADQLLQNLRIIKTSAEVKLLETSCRDADRGFVSALNHMEGNVTDSLNYDLWEFTERVRVHVGEFGGSGTGNVCTLQGPDMQVLYKPPRDVFGQGNLVRTEVTCHCHGYFTDNTRTFVIGEPSPEQLNAFQANISLKKVALAELKPGASCNVIFNTVAQAAKDQSVPLWVEAGIGHGVGLSEREAPFLTPDDATILQPGMVLTLAVYTRGPRQELICSKDTYLITKDGHELLSWYRDWDTNIYEVYGDTARHG